MDKYKLILLSIRNSNIPILSIHIKRFLIYRNAPLPHNLIKDIFADNKLLDELLHEWTRQYAAGIISWSDAMKLAHQMCKSGKKEKAAILYQAIFNSLHDPLLAKAAIPATQQLAFMIARCYRDTDPEAILRYINYLPSGYAQQRNNGIGICHQAAGKLFHAADDMTNAAANYCTAIRLHPRRWQNYYSQALALQAQGDYRPAKELLDQALLFIPINKHQASA